MPIEMPKGLPFSVDTWSPASDEKRHHFLTHAHRDHVSGIRAHFSYPVYATHLTKSLVLHYFPQLDDSKFVEIEIGKTIIAKDPEGDFKVTAYDANHCPGAVMFLFEGTFGNLLHTGDCRLTKVIVKNFKNDARNISQLDFVFLDCTFGRCFLQTPTKQSAIQQMKNCIRMHPNAPVVYLSCDLVGQEEILMEISKEFQSKIYVDQMNEPDCFHVVSQIAPEIITTDSPTRFHLIGFSKLYEKATREFTEARTNNEPEPLFIRPTTQWYAHHEAAENLSLTKAERDELGVWHVCYSMHSSKHELEWALRYLKPNRVVSTTPPCLAMDLVYVKRHRPTTRLGANDPIWKILKITSPVKCVTTDSTNNGNSEGVKCKNASSSNVAKTCSPDPKRKISSPLTSPVKCVTTASTHNGNSEGVKCKNASSSKNVEKMCSPDRKRKISSPLKEREVTLFGRARLERSDETQLREKEEVQGENGKTEGYVLTVKKDLELSENIYVKDNEEVHVDREKMERTLKGNKNGGDMGMDLNESLKKLYRSRNVPVPRPLPSLVELMGSTKRVRLVNGSS